MFTAEKRARAHEDLEGVICDVADMANVCRVLTERFYSDLSKARNVEWSTAVVSTVAADFEPVQFCVSQLHTMARRLRNQYYTPTEHS